MSHVDLVQASVSGDRRALARLISLIEAGDSSVLAALEQGGFAADAPLVGVTGPPGAGKSTLVNALIGEFRRLDWTVAVLAVDPSSPVTGGALLGDRIRMQGHVDDPGVFVRSMASRGHLGGLADASAPTLRALSSAGFDLVLVETVGVGQSEVEVMHLVDLVVLVLTPAWGDQVQADKAGIVEIADLFVINKGDLPGAAEVREALIQALGKGASPAILTTVATTGEGVGALATSMIEGLSA